MTSEVLLPWYSAELVVLVVLEKPVILVLLIVLVPVVPVVPVPVVLIVVVVVVVLKFGSLVVGETLVDATGVDLHTLKIPALLRQNLGLWEISSPTTVV